MRVESIRRRTLDSIQRREEGFVPFEFDLCPSLLAEFTRRTGKSDYRAFFGMPFRWVSAGPQTRDIDFTRYFPDLDSVSHIDAWGIGHKPGDYAHFERMIPPMAGFTSVDEFEQYPYPDPDVDFDWKAVTERIGQLKEKDLVSVAGMAVTIFEIAWYLRGMDTFLVDLMTETELAEYHMDRITRIRTACAARYAEAGVDVLHLGDDVATQRGMMISPEMWRGFLKPRLAAVIDAARNVNPSIIIDYHSDGDITAIVADLVEIGVDQLNPIQPECMDPYAIKREFGDRLSLRGAVGTQTTMPFGSAEEVEFTCRRLISELGRGGGFVLAPTHVLEPEVPWENIETLVRVALEHNA